MTAHALAALGLLALAGALPVLAVAGWRLVAIPLMPLGGAALAGVSASSNFQLGWSFTGWFVLWAAVAAAAAIALIATRPGRYRPRRPSPAALVAGALVLAALVATTAFGLHVLTTPAVGFDARAVWIGRAGWFFRSPASSYRELGHLLVPPQDTYPPMLPASVAVAWHLTGDHSYRLGQVLITALDMCALWAAAIGLAGARGASGSRPLERWAGDVLGAAVAGLLVLVTFGVTLPFVANGYADPMWSLGGVIAVVFGLQLPVGHRNTAVAAFGCVLAGMTKNEGVYVGTALLALVVARALWVRWRSAQAGGRAAALAPTGALCVVALVAIGAWPVVMHLHGFSITGGGTALGHDLPARARAALDGLAPYVRVLWLAVPISALGSLLLRREVRRAGGAGDAWTWVAWAAGSGIVAAAYLTGDVPVHVWMLTTADRVTEFSALVLWWLVARWALVAGRFLAAGGGPRSDDREQPGVAAAPSRDV